MAYPMTPARLMALKLYQMTLGRFAWAQAPGQRWVVAPLLSTAHVPLPAAQNFDVRQLHPTLGTQQPGLPDTETAGLL